jgi:hypothetical protein
VQILKEALDLVLRFGFNDDDDDIEEEFDPRMQV